MSRKCLTRFYVPVYGNIGVVFDRISAISNCYPQIPVNSGRFEDPCKGTYKYLEVEHTCQGKIKIYLSFTWGTSYQLFFLLDSSVFCERNTQLLNSMFSFLRYLSK